MPRILKRRAELEASPLPSAVRQRREEASPDASEAASDGGLDKDYDGDLTAGTFDQTVKNLVRLALASEYTRQPLRRTDITAKVLAPSNSRTFKIIFETAQERLRRVFGMTMTELPNKEKVTIAQKRAAQRTNGNSQGNSASSKAYVLTSTLPSAYRTPIILHPPKVPSVGAESGYIGLYSFIVSVIYLSDGSRISEGKLERYLKRCNADNYVLNGEKTENVLKKMEKQNYIVKIKEREPGGEEIIDYVVGPRGKVEVGEKGAAALVKTVYGKRDIEMEELEDKLEKSLGAGTFKRKTKKQGGDVDRDGEEWNPNEGEERERDAGAEAEAENEVEGSRTRQVNGASRRGNGRGGVAHTPQTRRPGRRSSGFVDDEAEGEEDELEDEAGEGEQDEEEDEEEED